MYTLRIVVLHADGSVEHNVYVDFGNVPQTECFRILEVTRNETKKIYLIANEESVIFRTSWKIGNIDSR